MPEDRALRLQQELSADTVGILAARDVVQRGSLNIGGNQYNFGALPSDATADVFSSLHQLPPDVSDFVGREVELRTLKSHLLGTREQDLARAGAVLVIAGKPGVGKSAIATHLAHDLTPHFPDGQLYVNLRSQGPVPLTASEILGELLRALGLSSGMLPQDVSQREALYRSYLVGKSILLLVDNADDASQVHPFLPANLRCALLVTSRRALTTLPGAKVHILQTLDQGTSVELLAGIAGSDRIEEDEKSARAVVEACGYLPLAIRIAGAKLAARPTWPISRLAERLSDKRRTLDQLSSDDLEVRASFALSYSGLRTVDARTFRLLALLPGATFTASLVARLIQTKVSITEDILDRLVDAQLLEVASSADRYEFHDLLRLYAHERLAVDESPGRQKAAVNRVIGWYILHEGGSAGALMFGENAYFIRQWSTKGVPKFTYKEAVEWFEYERSAVISIMEKAAELEDWRAAWSISALLSAYFELSPDRTHWKAVCQMGLTAASHTGDVSDRAMSIRFLGDFYAQQNQWSEARRHYDEALSIYHELGDRGGEQQVLGCIASILMEEHRFDEALPLLKSKAEYFREEVDDQSTLHQALQQIGLVQQRQGEWDEAVKNFNAVQAFAKETGNPGLEGTALANLGAVSAEQGQLDKALDYFDRGIAIFREFKMSHLEGQAYYYRGTAYADEGRWADALTDYNRAVAIYDEFGDTYLKGKVLAKMGWALEATEQMAAAQGCWNESLKILRQFNAREASEVEHALEELSQHQRHGT